MRTRAPQVDHFFRACTGVLLLLAACAPQPRWVAVAGGTDRSNIIIFSGNLTPADTFYLPAEEPPEHITQLAFAPDGSSIFLHVESDFTNALLRLRRADGVVVDRLALPHRIVDAVSLLTDVPNTILVTGRLDHPPSRKATLFLYSAIPLRPLARIETCDGRPAAVALIGVLNKAYVRCENVIAEVDLTLMRLVRAVSSDHESSCGQGDLASSRSGNILYFACPESGQLFLLDRATLRPVDSVSVGTGGARLATSPTRPVVLLGYPRQHRLTMLDRGSGGVSTISSSFGKSSVVSMDGSGLWAFMTTHDSHNRLIKLDLRTHRRVAVVSLASPISSVTVWPGPHSPVFSWVR